MGSTIVEKILARVSGNETVKPGDLVVCRPDQIVFHELMLAIEGAWYRPKKLAAPDRVALIYDHSIPAPTIKDASGMKEGRRFAQEFGVRLFDVGRGGISHVVAAEAGLARPGELYLCADSHTCALGAMNCAARGVGPVDLTQAMTKGLLWYIVYPTIRYEFVGELQPLVSGKDVFFHIAQAYGGHSGVNMEFGGAGLRALQMSDRRTIATMCAEVSSEFAVFEFDDETARFLEGRVDRALTPTNPDPDANYLEVRTIDLSAIRPYYVKPNFVPKNAAHVADLAEKIAIDQAFIGSCANGQIEDLRIAADILRGRKVAPGVRFIITPGSQAVALQAMQEGLPEVFLEAGAVFTHSTCGACFGGHMGLLAPGEVCITASTRNFKGRMGSLDAIIYMGSPATVAASAVAGHIADPRAVKHFEGAA